MKSEAAKVTETVLVKVPPLPSPAVITKLCVPADVITEEFAVDVRSCDITISFFASWLTLTACDPLTAVLEAAAATKVEFEESTFLEANTEDVPETFNSPEILFKVSSLLLRVE